MRSLFSMLLLAPALCTAQLAPIATFSDSTPPKWTEKSFSGYTDYRIIPYKSTQVLQANAVAAASGIMFEQRIDLTKTPHLNWSWQTSDLLEQLNELEKSGDDFVARVYVIIDGGWMIWNTLALNYVWSRVLGGQVRKGSDTKGLTPLASALFGVQITSHQGSRFQ